MLRLLGLVTAVFILLKPQLGYSISFDRYHDYTFIKWYLKEQAVIYDHVKYNKLGYSTNGLEIAALEITEKTSKTAPAIYINGTHHGNERASTEAALAVIDFLTKNKNKPLVRDMLRRYRFIIQPLVNPDGFMKESRFAAGGIDPNRDYPHPTNTGKPFRLVETQLVGKLMEKENFVGSVAFHSGIEAILWPWCFSDQKVYHERQFFTLGKLVAQAMGIRKYKQSYKDYKSEGEFIDYAYMTYGTYALTVEVSPLPKPDAYLLPRVVSKAVEGFIAYVEGLNKVQVQISQTH